MSCRFLIVVHMFQYVVGGEYVFLGLFNILCCGYLSENEINM
jgi:hypothetical protein